MKNNIKNLLCILVIIMLGSFFGTVAMAENDSVEILNSLGVVKGELYDIETDEKLSRADTAMWIYNLLGKTEEYNYSVFEDVIPGTKSSNAIMALYKMNIISGNGKIFRPNDAITRNEFFSMLCNTIGYSEIAKIQGGYPTGVIQVMSELGVIDGIGSNSEYLTIGDASHYMVKALKSNALEFEYNGGMISYEKSSNLVINEFLDIYIVKGWVEANSITSLYNPNGGRINSITIGGETYTVGIDNADELLGLYVEAYVKLDKNDDATVVAAVRKEKKYTEITVNTFDIHPTSTRTNIIYDEDDKIQDEKISVTADIIYNGVAYPDATVDEIYPDFGEVRLIDRDSDDVFDLVFVTAYTPVVSGGVDAIMGKIINKYIGEGFESIIKIDENDEVNITDIFDEPMELSDITENTVAFISKPKTGDANKYDIILSQKSVRGKVSTISSDNDVLAIEDTEYKLSDAVERAIKNKCLKALEVGKQYELYFDMYNRVFYYELIEESEGYGYVTKVYTDDAGDKNFIKMFCSDDVWRTIELREKIACDKVSVKSEDFVNTAVLNELVKYELDTKGKLKSIEYPILTDVEDVGYMDYIKDGRFTKVNINNERWLLNTVSFEGKYYTSKLEFVFSIPADGNRDEFKIVGLPVVSETRYSLSMYDLDEFSYGKVAVMTQTDGIGLNYTDNCMVVDKVITAYVEDEIVSVVYGFMNGQNVSFTGKDEHTFTGLKRGDIIRTKYNNGLSATGYELVHTFGNENEITSLSNWSDISDVSIIKCYASDVDYSNKRIRMNDILSGITYALRNDTIITVYDSINGEAKNGTINDLMTGDYIILRLRGGYFHELLIIKK